MLYVKWILGLVLVYSHATHGDVVLTAKKRTVASPNSFMDKYDRQLAELDQLSAQIGSRILKRDSGLTDANDKSGMKVALIPAKR